ncbi:MAG: SpoIIE family protein phosphatase [Candidatus Ozemobacteraceae bacterium]
MIKKYFPLIGFCFVFFGIPLLLTVYEIEQVFRAEQNDQRMRTARRLEKMIPPEVAERVTPSNIIQDYLRSQWNLQPVFGSPENSFASLVKMAKKHFPGNIEFLCLDEHGNPVASLSDVLAPTRLLRAFHRDYLSSPNRLSASMFANMDQYRSFLGPLAGRNQEAKFRGNCETASYLASRSTIYFSPPSRNRFFLAFLTRTPHWETLCRNLFAQTTMNTHRGLRCSFIDLTDTLVGRRFPWDDDSRYLGRVLLRLGERPGQFLPFRGQLWTQIPISPTLRFVFSLSDETVQRTHQRILLARCGGLGLFLLLTLVALQFLLGDGHRRVSLSIRWKLFFLFLYVVGIPIALLGISTHGYLRERRTVLEARTLDDLENLLIDFDRRFREGLGVLELRLKKMLVAPTSSPTSPLLEKTRERMRSILHRYKPAVCEIIGENGESFFHSITRWDNLSKRFLTIVQGGAANLIADINQPGGQRKEKAKDQFMHLTAEFFGFNIELVFSIFTENLGTLRDFSMANGRILAMLNPVFTQAGIVRYICMIGWATERLEYAYLTKRLSELKQGSGNIRIAAQCDNEDLDVCAGFPFTAQARNISRQVTEQPLPLKFRWRRGDRQGLFIGMKGNILRRYRLFASTDDALIRKEIDGLARRNFLLSMAIMMIALGVGRVLARSFLGPIHELGAGLEALGRRDFRNRIPITTNDELGDLSAAFNGMMEGLEDLETAKVVQENFFPAAPLKLGSWSIAGTCSPASRVGGDYFDYFALDDHRIAMVIGDVSGHGTSAALVVAMAKALISHPYTAPGGDFDPAKVLTILQKVFFSTLKRKKMMTCIMGVLDVTTGALRLASAGHNYPYLVKKGVAEHIEMEGMPLGTRMARHFPDVDLTLDADDCLILYTDGFIETYDRQGVMLGYPRVAAALPGIVAEALMTGSDAAHIETALRTWYEKIAMPGPLADDITLVVIRKDA